MIVNHRQNLLSNNNIPVIPRRKNRKEVILYDKTKYKLSYCQMLCMKKIRQHIFSHLSYRY
jgi:hypothetical protein